MEDGMTSDSDDENLTSIVEPPILEAFALPGYRSAALRVMGQAQEIVLSGEVVYGVGSQSPEGPLAYDYASHQLLGEELIPARMKSTLELTVKLESLLAGEFHIPVEQGLEQIAELKKEADSRMVEFLESACDATGQVAKMPVGRSRLDVFLDMVDMTEMKFDAEGKPDLSSFCVARMGTHGLVTIPAAMFLRELAEGGTVEQKTRFMEIVTRQHAEWDSGERSL